MTIVPISEQVLSCSNIQTTLIVAYKTRGCFGINITISCNYHILMTMWLYNSFLHVSGTMYWRRIILDTLQCLGEPLNDWNFSKTLRYNVQSIHLKQHSRIIRMEWRPTSIFDINVNLISRMSTPFNMEVLVEQTVWRSHSTLRQCHQSLVILLP